MDAGEIWIPIQMVENKIEIFVSFHLAQKYVEIMSAKLKNSFTPSETIPIRREKSKVL